MKINKDFKMFQINQNKGFIFQFFVLTILSLLFFAFFDTALAQTAGTATAGTPCAVVGTQDICGAGLICCLGTSGSNNTCQAVQQCNGGTNTPTPTPQIPSSITNISPFTAPCPQNYSLLNGLCLPSQAPFGTTGLAGATSLSALLVYVIQILLTFAGVLAVLMLVVGGYWYMAAGGNEELAEKGKKTIINFVLGLVIIIMAYTLVAILSGALTGNTGFPNL